MRTSTKVGLGLLGAVGAVGLVVAAKRAAAAKEAPPPPAPSSSTAPSASSSSPPKGPSGNGYELGNAKNVTDEIAPAPPDVNNPAPPGSHIVGEADPSDGSSAEMNRILNLRERWNRILKWGLVDPKSGLPAKGRPDEIVKYDAWRVFGNTSGGRILRTMPGWELQFRSLESVEDAIHSRDGSFVIDRRDVTKLPHKPGT